MIPTLLLLTALALKTQVLVLRSGAQIDIQPPVREENGRLLFRTADGGLYSIDRAELDEDATRARNENTVRVAAPKEKAQEPRKSDETMKLKGDEATRKRLIAEVEKNHAGQAPPRSPLLEEPPSYPSAEQVAREKNDEWSWRYRARAMEEAITQAKENRDLLASRAEYYRRKIQTLINLGFKPEKFSYDTFQLQFTIEQIPAAELEITRAERAYAQFLEDARRQGVLPGWLR